MWSIPRSAQLWLLTLLGSILLHWWYSEWTLIGFENAEVYGHVWNYDWRFSEGLLGTSRTIGTEDFPAIDVIPSILIGMMSWVISLESSYNLWIIISVYALGLSVAHLIHIEGGHVLSGVLIVTISPILWGTINSGLVEDLGLVLIVLTWLFVRKQRHVLAGVTLGCTAYFGLLQAWMAGVLLVGWMIVHRSRVRDMVSTVLTSTVMIVPLIWIHWERFMSIGHRNMHRLRDYYEPFWMLNPWHHADLASFFWSQPVDFQDAIIRLHPSYIGWTVLGVAFYSRAWRWLGLLGFCIVASLGPTIYWMGGSTEISNPVVSLLSWIPGAGLVNHHGRWMMLALVGLSVSVSIGMQKIRHRSIILTMMGFEYLFLGPVGMPLMGIHKVDSNVLRETQEASLQSETRLLRLPVRGPNVVFQEALYEQTIHQQPLWLSPNRPIIREWMTLGKESEWVEQVAFESTLTGSCVPREVGALLVKEPFVERVSVILGAPSEQDDVYALWTAAELTYCTN